MHAYHRLTGDFPKRGYGNTLRTPGFPEDGPVLTGTAPRLGHPAAMQPRPQDGSIVERFGTWELLSLAYGQMAVVHSSLVASTQGREHSYMDAVVASEAVQQSEPTHVPIEDLLLFNGFETPEDFWNMEKGATSMPASDWTKDSPAMLDNANDQGEALYTAPEGDALLCLLARYWHAASMQFFGPWDSDETHNQFLYNLPDTPDVVQQMMEAPSSLMAILYDHAYHPMQIRATKSFFYKTLIANLPHEVQGIATISAGCTASSLNQFTGSAMLVVPPAEDNGQANVDLRPGFERISSASADELALIRLILQSHKGLKAVPFLQPLQEVCQLAYGALNADRLAADWQLLLCLCRIDKETDAVKLVQQWYLLNSLLRDRHISKEESDEVAERRCNEWMHPVDMLVLHRLGLDKEQPAAKLKALGAQFDREKYLLIFFWRKAMTIIGDDERVAGLQTLNASCQTPRNQFFISSILRGSKNPEEDFAAAAPILKKVLALYYADGTLDEKHINLLLLQEKKNGTTVLKINNATRLVVQEYLRGELSAYVRGQRAAFPDEEMDYALYLLPLTMAFQPEDAPLEYAVEHATSSRATRLLTQRECAQIHTALEQLDDKRACELLLCRYVVNAFRALDDDRLDALKAMVAQLGFHADEAVKALLENADGRYSVERITWLSDLCKQCNKATIAAARIAYAVKHLLTQSELLVDAECQFIAESFEKNKVPDKLQDAATSYFKARYEGVIAQRVSAEDLQTVIRLTQLNATPAAEKIIRGAAPQRLTHEQQKMLIGTGSQAIVQAWQEYMKSVLTTSADAGEEDLLPWFQDSCKLLRDKGCKSDDGFEDNQSVDYILRYALKQRKAPSSLAFGVLSRVAESGFCGKVQQVQKVYDELLKTGDAQAQTQAIELLPKLGDLTAQSTLKALAEERLCDQLQGQWHSGVRYWDGLKEVLEQYPASGLRAMDLYSFAPEDFIANVQTKAEDELASIRDPAAFKERSNVPLQDGGGFAYAWNQALHAAYAKRYDEMFLTLDSFGALEVLNAALLQANVGALASYRCGACLLKIRGNLETLEQEDAPSIVRTLSILSECMDSLNCLESYDTYAPIIHKLLADRFRRAKCTDFLCRMVNACLLSIRAQKAPPIWQSVLTILLPSDWHDMLRRPYTAESLPLLQTVVALLRILQFSQAPENWREDLVRFLKVNLSDYTAALLKGKASSAYLPQSLLDELNPDKLKSDELK